MGFSEKYFTHAVGYPFSDSIFYKDVTPAGGSRQTSNMSLVTIRLETINNLIELKSIYSS